MSEEEATQQADRESAIEKTVEFLMSTSGQETLRVMRQIALAPTVHSMPPDDGSETSRGLRSTFRSLHRRGLTFFSGLERQRDGLWRGGDLLTDLGLDVIRRVENRQEVENARTMHAEVLRPIVMQAICNATGDMDAEHPSSNIYRNLSADVIASRAFIVSDILTLAGIDDFFRRVQKEILASFDSYTKTLDDFDREIESIESELKTITGDSADDLARRDLFTKKSEEYRVARSNWIADFRRTEHEDTA